MSVKDESVTIVLRRKVGEITCDNCGEKALFQNPEGIVINSKKHLLLQCLSCESTFILRSILVEVEVLQ